MSRWNVAMIAMTGVFAVAGLALSAGPGPKPGSGVSVRDSVKNIKFVNDTLAKVKAGDQASADEAEKALVEKGRPLLEPLQAALREAAKAGNQEKSAVAANAIMQIFNGVDPRKAIWDYVKKLPKYADEDVPAKLRLQPMVREDVVKNGRPMMFYVGRMKQGAVATMVPPPLAASNIFAFDTNKKNELTLITTPEKLKECVARTAVCNGSTAADCARLCLALAQELAQDGSYTFTVPADGVKVDKNKDGTTIATGKALVDEKTGSGQVEVTLTFAKNGKLTKFEMKKDLTPSMRPQ